VSPTPDAGDAAALAGLPRVVLDEDGIDRLELVLGGWAPASSLSGTADEDVVLTDSENTPLARVRTNADGMRLVDGLAPLASGGGPQWDPSVRLSLAEAKARIASAGRGARAAFVVAEVPALVDVEWVAAVAREPDVAVVVVVVPVARRVGAAGEVGWAGVTRAAWALADSAAAGAPQTRIVRLAIPWPGGDGLASILAAGGIDDATPLTAVRNERDRAAIAAMERPSERTLEEHYPPASASELLRAWAAAPVGSGAVVFFTGLSGSGKSTLARALADELADAGPRRVTLLDGDEVRQHLSRGLGFDAESREINVDRIAWVASLVAAHGGIAVAAPIAPFAEGRRNARALAEARGAVFLLVWVSTPLDVCESRDRKGLYALARTGQVTEFTGITSPYEPPDDADVIVDTTDTDVPSGVGRIRAVLDARLGLGAGEESAAGD